MTESGGQGPDGAATESTPSGAALPARRRATDPGIAAAAAPASPVPTAPPGEIAGIARGDIDLTASLEVLQVGYLHTVAAAVGVKLSNPQPDKYLDWTVLHMKPETFGNEAEIKIQLKASAALQVDPSKPDFLFRLKNDHLRYLGFPAPTIPRILVVMKAPRTVEEWVEATHDHTKIRNCCYWVNLDGEEPRGPEKTSVSVPTSQIFDAFALSDMIDRIYAGGKP